MNRTTNSSVPVYDAKSSSTWQELYPSLRALIRRQVYSYRLPSWSGQEDEIVEDILQETSRRIFEYALKAEMGRALPIYHFEHMVIVTARNCCKDLRRRDRRFKRLEADTSISVEENVMRNLDQTHLSEAATESVYREGLFVLMAQEIATFPSKQKQALLADLASLMSFEEQPTSLQKAFLDAGIRLEEYRDVLPSNEKERQRYASLLYHAYKRVALLARVQAYASVA
jgi:DNA-directed RNA polymerase specialized sigma24 family protein